MHRQKGFRPLLCCLLCLLLIGCSSSEPPEYDWSALSQSLDRFGPDGEAAVSGYSFALAIDGRTVFRQAGGDMTTDSRVPIASASKAPTAAAILTLVQDGLLDLDRPVSDYLGLSWPAIGPASRITTRMLLNHTSGLPFTTNCLDRNELLTLADCVQQIARLALQFEPGERFLYSATGYQVAGLVAQRISGLGWKDFFASRFGTRIGLVDYEYVGDGNPRLAGGAISSAADYLKILQLVLDGGRAQGQQLLSPELARSLRSNQIAGLPVDFTPIPDGIGLNGYSFGWWISDPDLHLPSRGPELSDPGIFGTVPWLDFDRRYAAIILIDGDDETGQRMFSALRPLILQQIDRPGSH